MTRHQCQVTFPVGEVTQFFGKVASLSRSERGAPAKVLCPAGKVVPQFGQVTHPAGKVTHPAGKVTQHLEDREQHSGKLDHPVARVTHHLGNREHHFSRRDHHPELVTLQFGNDDDVSVSRGGLQHNSVHLPKKL